MPSPAATFQFKEDFITPSELAGNTLRIDPTEGDALTTASDLTVDATWDADAATVVNNLRTRLNEVEARLQTIGFLP